jgi:alpha-beta hydrolase superfamily lysophospholipase
MSKQIVAALVFWLGLLEALLRGAGLRGLSWGGGPLGVLLAALAARRRPGPLLLSLTLPVALLAQVSLATLRRHGLNPKLALAPAAYQGWRIERVDVPGAYGPVPALHVVPAGGATTAVCVAHGSGCDKTFYAWRMVERLTAQGAALLLIDLDGHGESPRPQAYPDIIESVAGPARWLRERYERVVLLGMSLGAVVTARAVAEGASCDALILWAAPPRLRLSNEQYRQVQLAEAMRIARPTLLHLFRDGSAYHVARAWQTSGIRARIGTWDLIDALDPLASLGRIQARADRPPLLLVYAGRDAVLHPGSGEEVRRATAGWSSFHLVRGASHVSLPIEPETLDVTEAWLAGLSGRRADSAPGPSRSGRTRSPGPA